MKKFNEKGQEDITSIVVFLFYIFISYAAITFLVNTIPIIGIIKVLGSFLSVQIIVAVVKDIYGLIKDYLIRRNSDI